jgi:hypothetical protein
MKAAAIVNATLRKDSEVLKSLTAMLVLIKIDAAFKTIRNLTSIEVSVYRKTFRH